MKESLAERQQWLRSQAGISHSAAFRKALRDAQEAARRAQERAAVEKLPDYTLAYAVAVGRRRTGKARIKAERAQAELERRRALLDEMTQD